MARLAFIPLILLTLSSCSTEKEPSDAEAVAAVEAAQDGKHPVEPISPQAILYPDISKHKLHGTGCAFVAEGGGIGAVLLAQDERGVLKLNGEIQILAPDTGSAKLPKGSWSRYSGKEYALTLTASGPVEAVGTSEHFDGKLVITDEFERPVYSAIGNVQCKAI
ncbi:MAG: hypothetical protein B7Y31_05385 [Novosphingobium sp. 16-62-11]|uniref:hypothetical protein n=1 Tax=Novosphingobium sp. 17-62-19 TaxID=1970406 RepID=UPI000BCCDD3B|nr:hypothetical protein [Novosphingobium sp. 17-62-19]OYZ42186.1 MAG: hypothetical protein B7Y31_05385 [Novosphingobium sp. 16-62-11]OZA21416.1 MAG: hypothetical protein B7X90_02035 [Novosphingobium sp. 17-62-19]HQS95034.1 hypothetical protein [Novosphingobium sp.]